MIFENGRRVHRVHHSIPNKLASSSRFDFEEVCAVGCERKREVADIGVTLLGDVEQHRIGAALMATDAIRSGGVGFDERIRTPLSAIHDLSNSL